MLEILVLVWLTKRIGSIVEEKGRKSGWYKALTVGLWFGGEIIGLIFGILIAGETEFGQCLLYVSALMGAALGAGVAYLIASNLPPSDSVPPPASLSSEDFG